MVCFRLVVGRILFDVRSRWVLILGDLLVDGGSCLRCTKLWGLMLLEISNLGNERGSTVIMSYIDLRMRTVPQISNFLNFLSMYFSNKICRFRRTS